MANTEFRFCDVALPVPLDRLFTYELPLTLRHRVRAGSRVAAPLGSRKLVGVVVRVHDNAPEVDAREVFGLRDEEPVLDAELISLAFWMAEYYCAPVGEVMKSMLPLSGEVRRSTIYSLTADGREVARQLIIRAESDPGLQILAALAERERPVESLKFDNAKAIIRSLIKRGWVVAEDREARKDPLRAPAERLTVEFAGRPNAAIKLKKAERELIAFLELHPGPHPLTSITGTIKNVSEAARALGRRELVKLVVQGVAAPSGYERPVPVLNQHQQTAYQEIERALAASEYKAFLLQGVTGSGKTEVYLRAIEAALAAGRNALLLVPEIALTPAMAGQFFQRFGKQVAILHSAFGDSERADQWRRVRNGQARVVVGTRSGVFAPVQNLGLIIVDEEHDGSYKQQETPRYHGRDVAIMRARNSNAVTVLGSATPSIETRFNADEGRYTILRLPQRIAARPMPEVRVVDMRVEFLETKRQNTFSRVLLEEMETRLKNGEQTMLLLNRRGFSTFMVCRHCGERMQCENCSVTLTLHRRDRRMLCHLCGFAEKVPTLCPKCGSEQIQFLGTGSERVEDEIHQHLPGARVARLDRDSTSSKGSFEAILASFRDGDIDILVGTQMIAKGHDIANVTLVGIVLADIGLSIPDFRAAERTFQLLTQAAGRAGRGTTPGQVIIQSLNPDHYAIGFAAEQDYEGFFRKELEFRKYLRYPPYSACANLLIRAEKQEEALRLAGEIGFQLTPQPPGVRVMGPAEASVLRVRNEFRYQVFLKAARRAILRDVIKSIRAYAEKQKWKATSLVIDVDPIHLL